MPQSHDGGNLSNHSRSQDSQSHEAPNHKRPQAPNIIGGPNYKKFRGHKFANHTRFLKDKTDQPIQLHTPDP